jgi:hypothetical protein
MRLRKVSDSKRRSTAPKWGESGWGAEMNVGRTHGLPALAIKGGRHGGKKGGEGILIKPPYASNAASSPRPRGRLPHACRMTGDPWAALTVVGGLQTVSGTGHSGELVEGTKDGGAQSEDFGRGWGWVPALRARRVDSGFSVNGGICEVAEVTEH